MRPIDECMQNPLGKNEYFLGALIGGLFARSSAKKAAKLAAEAAKVPVVTSHKVDLAGMNAEAIKNGYHPMTLLNAGGLSAFTTTSVTGQNAMAAAQAAGAVPSMGSVFAGAFSETLDTLAGSVFKAVAPEAPMSRNYFPPAPSAGGGMAAAMGWNTLAKTPAGSRVASSGASFSAGMPKIPKGLGNAVSPEAGERTVTNPYDSSKVDPSVGDAEGFETRYSDWGSYVAAPYIAWQDYLFNKTGITSRQRAVDPGLLQTERQAVKDGVDMLKHGDPLKVLQLGLMTFEAARGALREKGWLPTPRPFSKKGGGGGW